MILKSVKYTENTGTPREWILEGLSLGKSNLIVGKNATGKSRTLNLIHALAKNLAGLRSPGISSKYDVEFTHEDKGFRYELEYKDRQVLNEKFTEDGKILLSRNSGGEGEILAEQIDNGKMIPFQSPPSDFAVVVRRDNIQHKYLEPLYTWGSLLNLYYFGSQLNKENLRFTKSDINNELSDSSFSIDIFKKADEEFSETYKQVLIDDMHNLNYDITDVGIRPPVSIHFRAGFQGEFVGLFVKESDLSEITDQISMSQGMFRALSILIHINYSKMANKSSCILIDDIGEGLDFDRSCRLIDLIREKTINSNIQLILSTNDQFVMNRVPLKEWLVLQRHGSHVFVRNYENSKDIFEEFRFTGLSNFSFLEMDFVNGLPTDEVSAHE